jgi:hypothetical protein
MKYTIRAGLCVGAVLALGLSTRLHRRRQNAPNADSPRDRLIAVVFSVGRIRSADRLVLAHRTFAAADFGPRARPEPRTEVLDVGEATQIGVNFRQDLPYPEACACPDTASCGSAFKPCSISSSRRRTCGLRCAKGNASHSFMIANT